jgi:hypothetical protein
MALTSLAQSGYVPWNVRKFHVVDSIANLGAPTLTELGTGTDITPQVTAYDGFYQEGVTVDSQSFVGPALKLSGAPTLADSSITCRASATATDDIRGVWTDGDVVLLVIYPDGLDAAGGDVMDVFKLQVNSMQKSTDPNEAATIMTTFAIIATPSFNVDIPTT